MRPPADRRLRWLALIAMLGVAAAVGLGLEVLAVVLFADRLPRGLAFLVVPGVGFVVGALWMWRIARRLGEEPSSFRNRDRDRG